MTFLKNNKVFSCLYLLALLVAFCMIYKLGFRDAVAQIAGKPERLRDITFAIWDSYSPRQHGFLVFYSLEDFHKKIAYSSHSTAYLFFMYVFYKIEMLVPHLQMRITAAWFNMAALAGVVFFIVSQLTEKRIEFAKAILILLAMIFMVSMPDFWISAARANVDNPLPLVFALQALVVFFVWKDNGQGKRVVISLAVFAIFAPSLAVLLGISLMLCSVRRNGLDPRLAKLGLLTALAGFVLYFPPPVVAKLLGFSSSNSGWLFRSGLDGDRTYFSNILLSILFPVATRPVHIIALPILFLMLQAACFGLPSYFRKESPGRQGEPLFVYGNGFCYLLFSQYILSSLLWPQAIAIHPYLYDYLLLAPVLVLIVLNFVRYPVSGSLYFWILALLFCISFDFQQIAQAKCDGCFYPVWSKQ